MDTALDRAGASPNVGTPSAPTAWYQLGAAVWVPLTIYSATRLVDALLIMWVSGAQRAMPRRIFYTPTPEVFVHTPTPPDPGYLGIATNWDGQWYQYLAVEGYQPASPGSPWHVVWGWAFPPGYPWSVSSLMDLTGLSFPVAAVTVSLLFGAVAMVLLFRLAERHVGRIGAGALVACVCLFPSAPLLQVAYSESLALMLIAWSLLHIEHRQYWWGLIPLTLLAFTRLVTPPLAAVALVIELVRWRKDERASPRQLVGFATYVGASLAGVFAWSLITQSQTQGWGASRVTNVAANYSLGWFGSAVQSAPSRGVFLVVVFTCYLVLTMRQWRHWGPVLTTWATVYPLFVLLSTTPTTGLFRYLLLALPLALMPSWARNGASTTTMSGSRRVRVVIMIVGLTTLQALWLRYSFIFPEAGFVLTP